MKRIKRSLLRAFIVTSGLAGLICTVTVARADSISFQLSSTSLTATSGGTVTFDGTIANDSGTDLLASDFFFNFFGYDFSSVTPTQDLGVTTDFLIPNGATSSDVALFDVVLGTVAAGSSFPIQVQLEDVKGDLSATQTVTVNTGTVTRTTEPATLFMIGVGLLGILGMGRRTGL